MKYLVTGGAGFIGSHLVEKLIELGHEVIIADDLSTGKLKNLPEERNYKFYRNVFGDITNYPMLCSKVFKENRNIDAIFHVAALPRVQFSIINPAETHDANINGTFNILMAAKEFNIPRVVFSSSSSVYGTQQKTMLNEGLPPNPMSPYALHKLTGEQYCKMFFDLYGLQTVILRYFNVFGIRQDPHSQYSCLIPKSMYLLMKDEPPVIYGDGEQTRSFNYVSDIVDANLKAANVSNNNKTVFGTPINIGSSTAYSVNQVVTLLKQITGRTHIDPVHTDPVIEAKHTCADNSCAKSLLGWEPSINFEDGLKILHKCMLDVQKT